MTESPGVCAHLKALGVPISLRAHGAQAGQLHAEVSSAWSRCLRSDEDDGEVVDIGLGPSESHAGLSECVPGIAVFDSLDAAMHSISSLVTLRAIQARAGHLLMLHACAVADPGTGRTVALVGRSGAGKTTAARALCAEFAYVTDETVGVTETYEVLSYPKPLSVLQDGRPLKEQVSPDALSLVPPPSALRLHAVLLLDRAAGLGSAEVRPVPTLEAMAQVATETSYLSRLDLPLHRLAGGLMQGAGAQKVTYSEAPQLLDVVRHVIGT